MDGRLSTDPEREMLQYTFEGCLASEDFDRLMASVGEDCARREIRSLVLDFTSVEIPAEMWFIREVRERRRVAVSIEGFARRFPGISIAAVMKRGQRTNIGFLQLKMANVDVHIFTDIDTARNWIDSEKGIG